MSGSARRYYARTDLLRLAFSGDDTVDVTLGPSDPECPASPLTQPALITECPLGA